MQVEELWWDKDLKVSSQPIIRRGPNRGRARKEVGGVWKYCAGYYPRVVGATEWAKTLMELGHRIGRHYYEGVVSYYIFVPKK